MYPVNIILWNVLWLVSTAGMFTNAEETTQNHVDTLNHTRELDIFPGVKLHRAKNDLWISFKVLDFLEEINIESRNKEGEEKKGPLKKIGTMLMMAPFFMQLISLPGAFASIKMSLLRSIFVAKLALVILLFNALRNLQNSEVVVVQQPQHHQHYYHSNYHPSDDDDDSEW